MKLKRILVMTLAATMAFSLAACGSDSAAASTPTQTAAATATPTPEPTVTATAAPTAEPTAEATAAPTPTDAPSAEPAVTAAPTSEVTEAPSAEPPATPAPTSQVDYSGDMTDWMYTHESDDALTQLLITIDSTPYGVAGASLQQANSAVCLMKLAMDESGKASDAVSTYLSEMNDTQKDYFSFQWQQALSKANALLDGTMDAGILEDSGNDLDLQTVDTAKLTALNETVTQLLRSAGVTDQWKNQTDVEFFAVAS